MIKFTYCSAGNCDEVCIPIQLRNSSWYHIWAGYDLKKRRLILGCQDDSNSNKNFKEQSTNQKKIKSPSNLVLAAKKVDKISHQHFNGRLEGVSLYSNLPIANKTPCFPEEVKHGDLLASWDFSIGIETQSIVDRGPYGLSGRLVNIPYRAMRGSNWNGNLMHWKMKPE